MKSFSFPHSSTAEIAEHVKSTGAETIIFDAGHIPSTPFEAKVNEVSLKAAAAIAEQLAGLGLIVQPQFLVEQQATEAGLITRQIALAKSMGLEFPDPIFEDQLHPGALAVLETIKSTLKVTEHQGHTFWQKPGIEGERGAPDIPGGRAKLLHQGQPTSLLTDTHLVESNRGTNVGFVTVVPTALRDQQRNVRALVNALHQNLCYTSVLTS